jgi:hypothetical protein
MRPIFLFVGIAYGLSIALNLVVGMTGGYQSNLIGLRYLSMFLPAVSVLIVQAAMGEGSDAAAGAAGFLALLSAGILLLWRYAPSRARHPRRIVTEAGP